MFKLSEETKSILMNRFKSFLWRLLGMAAAASLVFVSDNLNLLELPPYATVVIGLVIGEITKMLNTSRQ